MTKAFQTFLIIGFFTFSIDYVIYLILLHVNVNLNISKFISSLVAVILGYYLNSKYNFGKDNYMTILRLVIYIVIYLILIIIHVYINRSLVEIFNNVHIAVFLAMSFSIIINFLAIKTYFKILGEKNVIRNSKK